MVNIGIFSPENKNGIGSCLKSLFAHFDKKVFIPRIQHISSDILDSVINSGIDFCIIDLENNITYVDILILDSKTESKIKDIAKCISPSTHLIYNIDSGIPEIIHPYAVSYGLGTQAIATISSIDDLSIIYCLQKPVLTLEDKQIDENEVRINSNYTLNTEKLLPAITCGMLCGIIDKDNVII